MEMNQALMMIFAVIACIGLVMMLFSFTPDRTENKNTAEKVFKCGMYVAIGSIAAILVLIIVGTVKFLMK